jgi:hypothetical protein
MSKLLFAALLIAWSTAVVPAPVASAAPCSPGAGPGGLANSQACTDCVGSATAQHQNPNAIVGICGLPPVHVAPAGPVAPGPGRNQHCNSMLNQPGNDNSAIYSACCQDAVLAGQTPC